MNLQMQKIRLSRGIWYKVATPAATVSAGVLDVEATHAGAIPRGSGDSSERSGGAFHGGALRGGAGRVDAGRDDAGPWT